MTTNSYSTTVLVRATIDKANGNHRPSEATERTSNLLYFAAVRRWF